jgi:uncharacterized protein YdaU (DUF1376 family)
MNFYEHHIGDWDSATAHLSLLEEAVYGRLIRLYYRTEKPIPADVAQACRLVRAVTKQERQAVKVVLSEFFVQAADGWRQKRCDEEIARYHQGDDERAQKQAHETERMRRHREERSRLFGELRERGITPKWDTPITDLRALHKRIRNGPATDLQREQVECCNGPATDLQREQVECCNGPATATQYPLPTTQEPEKGETPLPPLPPDGGGDDEKPPDPFSAFWAAYPRKVGKEAARKAWLRLPRPADTLRTVLAALQWQRESDQWTRDNGQFVPNPATYLRQQRWLDEPPRAQIVALTSVGQRNMAVAQRWLEAQEASA